MAMVDKAVGKASSCPLSGEACPSQYLQRFVMELDWTGNYFVGKRCLRRPFQNPVASTKTPRADLLGA